jgi:protein gp37
MAGNHEFSLHHRKTYKGECAPFLDVNRINEPIYLRTPARIGVQFMGDLYHPKIDKLAQNKVIETAYNCPEHTFLHLTKRPQAMLEARNWEHHPPLNLWPGVSICNNKEATEKMPVLAKFPSVITTWISAEPLLEDIADQLEIGWGLDWVVAGCESGPGRRTTDIDWFRKLRDKCLDANVPFFLKQMEIDGKVVEMPKLDGMVWCDMPITSKQYALSD